MKNLVFIAMLLFSAASYSEENHGQICLHIPEKGVETVKVERNCKKGDIIQINKQNIANLCDFNSAVINYDGHEQYVCVYLGEKREFREGTN